MGVDGGEPEEKGLVLGAVLDVIDPILLFAGAASAGDAVKSPILVAKHVVLSGKHGVVACFPKELGKRICSLGRRTCSSGAPVL